MDLRVHSLNNWPLVLIGCGHFMNLSVSPRWADLPLRYFSVEPVVAPAAWRTSEVTFLSLERRPKTSPVLFNTFESWSGNISFGIWTLRMIWHLCVGQFLQHCVRTQSVVWSVTSMPTKQCDGAFHASSSKGNINRGGGVVTPLWDAQEVDWLTSPKGTDTSNLSTDVFYLIEGKQSLEPRTTSGRTNWNTRSTNTKLQRNFEKHFLLSQTLSTLVSDQPVDLQDSEDALKHFLKTVRIQVWTLSTLVGFWYVPTVSVKLTFGQVEQPALLSLISICHKTTRCHVLPRLWRLWSHLPGLGDRNQARRN